MGPNGYGREHYDLPLWNINIGGDGVDGTVVTLSRSEYPLNSMPLRLI